MVLLGQEFRDEVCLVLWHWGIMSQNPSCQSTPSLGLCIPCLKARAEDIQGNCVFIARAWPSSCLHKVPPVS